MHFNGSFCPPGLLFKYISCRTKAAMPVLALHQHPFSCSWHGALHGEHMMFVTGSAPPAIIGDYHHNGTTVNKLTHVFTINTFIADSRCYDIASFVLQVRSVCLA
jgi:hypothetical protein